MDEKQQEFISWLSDKLQAQDQEDLKQKLKQMGEDGIRQAYDQYMSESSDVQSNKDGGKLDYIRCLNAFKRGGMLEMKKCGCGGKMEDGGKMLSNKMDKRKDVNVKEKNPGKKDWMSNGKKKEHTAVGGIKKNQLGGVATYAQGTPKQSNILVTKDNGSVGQWGNALPQAPAKNYMLKPAQNGVNQINDTQIAGIPNFQNTVGQPYVDNGVSRYGAEQSDMIRQLLAKYKNQAPSDQRAQQMVPAAQQMVASNAKGGSMKPMKKLISMKAPASRPTGFSGARKDADTKDQPSKYGDRMDTGKKEHTAVGGSNSGKQKLASNGNGSRKDVHTKEKNPGKKDWMDLGKKIQWRTAVTKVPKGQEGAKLPGGQATGKQTLFSK